MAIYSLFSLLRIKLLSQIVSHYYVLSEVITIALLLTDFYFCSCSGVHTSTAGISISTTLLVARAVSIVSARAVTIFSEICGKTFTRFADCWKNSKKMF